MIDDENKLSKASDAAEKKDQSEQEATAHEPGEVGGPKGPEPTRYGDWEKKGRCIDF